MRKSLLLLLGILVLVSAPAWAQSDYSKGEVFGGFSILSVGDGERDQFYGFQASVAGNLNKTVGIVADFGGQYKTFDSEKVHVYEYMFGPRFNMRQDKATVFAEALFGGVTAGGGGETDNGFVMGFGGGLDINASKHVGIRLFQFDWLPNHVGGEWSKSEFRAGFGIILK
jgi:hypothetical protein